jgi:TRAP-type C4-dicarboxylate transport system permease small subunit
MSWGEDTYYNLYRKFTMRLRVRAVVERLLEFVAVALVVILTIEVILGVTFRKFGASLGWYDEIASVTLAWLTYYGAALAALKRAHIGVPNLMYALKPAIRLPLALLGEGLVLFFFAVMAWTGWQVLDVLATDTLVSLPHISVSYTQSVIPIGATLFFIAEALIIPDVIAEARAGIRPGDVHGRTSPGARGTSGGAAGDPDAEQRV